MLPSFIFMQGWLRQNAMSTQARHGNSVALPLESAQRPNRSSDTPRLLVLALRWFELADRADYLITRVVTARLIPIVRPQPMSAASKTASSFTAPSKHIHEMWESVFRPKVRYTKEAASS
jgi:hypothetical protein